MVSRFQRLLSQQPPAGHLGEAEILDREQPVTFYRGRWMKPKKHSGLFVGRRPQEFGAPLWCAMLLADGTITHLVDLPLPKTRWRGCDVAWHLQMAIDATRGDPQRYRRRETPDGVRFDLFSPIPEWAERRLMVFGRSVPKEKSLFAYELPKAEAATESRFFENHLWLSPAPDSE
jgi:hypothetical protein